MKTKFIVITAVLILIVQNVFSQTGIIGNIDITQNVNNGIKVTINNVVVGGMLGKKAHFGVMVSQSGAWLNDSWKSTYPDEVKYDPAYWDGEAFTFYYTYDYLNTNGNKLDYYSVTFFIMESGGNTVVARKDTGFRIPADEKSGNNNSSNNGVNNNITRLISFDEFNKIQDLFMNGEIIQDQSFYLNLPAIKDSYFISVMDGAKQVNFYLVKNFKMIFTFPLFYGNSWSVNSIKAVSFKDMNDDGFPDVTVIAECVTGMGRSGADPFLCASVYYNDKKNQFMPKTTLDEQISNKMEGDKNFKTVNDIYNFLKTKK
jgi:hypothetical protein